MREDMVTRLAGHGLRIRCVRGGRPADQLRKCSGFGAIEQPAGMTMSDDFWCTAYGTGTTGILADIASQMASPNPSATDGCR